METSSSTSSISEQVMLLTWLHNIYLQPFGKITVRVATSSRMNALYDDSLVEYVIGHATRVLITPKGKKYLAKNLHLLIDDEIPNVDVAATIAEIEAYEI